MNIVGETENFYYKKDWLMWIDLKLTKEEALVLFEMLARWEDRNLINYLDDAVGFYVGAHVGNVDPVMEKHIIR